MCFSKQSNILGKIELPMKVPGEETEYYGICRNAAERDARQAQSNLFISLRLRNI